MNTATKKTGKHFGESCNLIRISILFVIRPIQGNSAPKNTDFRGRLFTSEKVLSALLFAQYGKYGPFRRDLGCARRNFEV